MARGEDPRLVPVSLGQYEAPPLHFDGLSSRPGVLVGHLDWSLRSPPRPSCRVRLTLCDQVLGHWSQRTGEDIAAVAGRRHELTAALRSRYGLDQGDEAIIVPPTPASF